MIAGRVNADLEAMVPVGILRSQGDSLRIHAAIDTGFNGYLSLPSDVCDLLQLETHSFAEAELADGHVVTLQRHMVSLSWSGRPRESLAVRAEGVPLIGMALLDGHSLSIDVKKGGDVRIEPAGTPTN
ncbi:MAG: hypothetical protein CHACPFDD_02664 [Phycisphaerae bacterium]|nr:hypothetical protein [Phycisphaerae bacterium]